MIALSHLGLLTVTIALPTEYSGVEIANRLRDAHDRSVPVVGTTTTGDKPGSENVTATSFVSTGVGKFSTSKDTMLPPWEEARTEEILRNRGVGTCVNVNGNVTLRSPRFRLTSIDPTVFPTGGTMKYTRARVPRV